MTKHKLHKAHPTVIHPDYYREQAEQKTMHKPKPAKELALPNARQTETL
jgi:hypothetical protein